MRFDRVFVTLGGRWTIAALFIHGVNVPLVILADPAYPLLPCVQHGNLSVAAKNFNYRLSRARMVVENALVVLRVAGVAS